MNDIKIPLVIKRFKALTNGKQSYQLPKIKKAELKDLGGLYGALALCGQK